MNADKIIQDLTRSCFTYGEEVILRRYLQGSIKEISTKGYVKQVKSDEQRRDSSGAQLNARVILSPVGLESLLPLKVTDKIVRTGVERNIGCVDNKKIGDQFVRIEIDYKG